MCVMCVHVVCHVCSAMDTTGLLLEACHAELTGAVASPVKAQQLCMGSSSSSSGTSSSDEDEEEEEEESAPDR